MNVFTDARIAGLKAGLQLTPDQAKNWPAVEQAMRDMAKARQDGWQRGTVTSIVVMQSSSYVNAPMR